MQRTLIRYKVKADRAEENAQAIAEVFEQLHATAPDGVRYAAFRLEDGVSFVHLVSRETGDGSQPLLEIPAFQAFIASIRDRCEEHPVAIELEEIGAYRLFAG